VVSRFALEFFLFAFSFKKKQEPDRLSLSRDRAISLPDNTRPVRYKVLFAYFFFQEKVRT